MCSTPRPSRTFRGSRRVAATSTLHRSYTHMMRTASAHSSSIKKPRELLVSAHKIFVHNK